MNKRIKVLNILLDDRIGGSHSRIFSITDGLRKSGIEPLMVLPKGNGKIPHDADKYDIKVFRNGTGTPHFLRDFRTFLLNIKYIFNFITSLISTKDTIKNEEIDIVHINGFLGINGAIVSKLMRKPTVWHLHGTLYPRFLIWLIRPIIRVLADRIVNISDSTRRYYMMSANHKERIIFEPVDTEIFDSKRISNSKKESLRDKLSIERGDTVFCSVGNLSWLKGYENLIEAMAILKKRYKNVKLIIAGLILDTQKGYYRRLKQLTHSFDLDDNVLFLGRRDDIPELLSITDIFILPSLYEGTPISILEAMSMGVPVIASRVSGIPEQITNREDGILIPPGDPCEIALAAMNLIDNSPLRKRIKENAREKILRKFSLDKCIDEHEKLYRELV